MIGRPAGQANGSPVNPAQMVKRAQRDPVCEIVRAARGAEDDVMILQVPHRRAAGNHAAPAIARKDSMPARNLLPVAIPVATPFAKNVIQHRAERLSAGRQTPEPELGLEAPLNGAEQGPKDADHLQVQLAAHGMGLLQSTMLRTDSALREDIALA